MKSLYHYSASLLCGALLTLAYAPFSVWPLLFVGLTGFFYLLKIGQTPFKTGLSFGLGWFGAGISWVHVSIADFGGLPLIGSLGLMLLLCAYLALFPAIYSLILQRVCGSTLWPICAALLWFVMENIRSWLFTGFPWLSVGYTQINSPLSGWMPVIGETGLSALIILVVSSIVIGITQRNWWHASGITAVVFFAGWVFNTIPWVTKAPSISVAMAQGNIQQHLRWVPEQEKPTMDKYLAITKPHWHNNLIIWPEAAIPQLEPIAETYIQKLDQYAADMNTGLITGIVNYDYNRGQAFNNLIALGRQQSEDTKGQYHYLHDNRYAKHQLLPIGEFIPFESWLRELAPIFDLPMSSFTRGDYVQPNLVSNGIKLAPAICFEIAFPRQIRANLREDTDFIITVSNDAWFGASHGPDQHLEIAQVRAKEFATPVLRATNNGITAFIDHNGNIISQLPQFETAVLSANVHPTIGKTPYKKWGDTPAWCLITLFFLGYFFLMKRFALNKRVKKP